MSNYVQTTFFTPKDSLPPSNPAKTIFGAAYDVEFGNISTAIASKVDAGGSIVISLGAINLTANIVPANGWYLPSANTLGVSTASTQRGTINATGNWAINAPSSGVALTVNGVSGAAPLIVNQGSSGFSTFNSLAAASAGILLQQSGQTGWNIYNPASTNDLRLNAGADRVVFTSAGNVTINVPASGVALTVNGVAGAYPVTVNSQASNYCGVLLQVGATNKAVLGVAGINGDFLTGTLAGDTVLFSATGTNSLFLGASLTTPAIKITSAGNVTINAPSSGVALSAVAASGAAAILAQATGTAAVLCTSNPGVFTGIEFAQSGQTAMFIYNPASSSDMRFQLGGADRLAITSAGNVTINAPSSGAALQVNQIAAGFGLQLVGAASASSNLLNVVGSTGITAPVAFIQSQTAGQEPLRIQGSAATEAYINFNWGANTGANTLTPTWTNYPGTAGTKNPASWIPVKINGSLAYIPCFN